MGKREREREIKKSAQKLKFNKLIFQNGAERSPIGITVQNQSEELLRQSRSKMPRVTELRSVRLDLQGRPRYIHHK